MDNKFTIEEHEKRIREILNQKAPKSGRSDALQALLNRGKRKIKKPGEGERPW